MSQEWMKIINLLSFINPKCINKENLKLAVEFSGRDMPIIIDELYSKKVLTREEYIDLLEVAQNRYSLDIQSMEESITKAKEDENYNPINYCCSLRGFNGPII